MAEDNDTLVFPRIEWLERLAAKIRLHSNSICLQIFECRSCVLLIRVGDVCALRIEDDRHARRTLDDIHYGLSQSRYPLVSMRFVKSRVGLIGADYILRRVNDGAIERNDGRPCVFFLRSLRYLCDIGIQSDA